MRVWFIDFICFKKPRKYFIELNIEYRGEEATTEVHYTYRTNCWRQQN